MKNVLELNIGLVRNTDNLPNKVEDIYDALQEFFGKHDFRLVNTNVGDWGGEETYVAKIQLNHNNLKLVASLLKSLCRSFKQDAIAYILDEVGDMAFNNSYKGERYSFNIEYFEKF